MHRNFHFIINKEYLLTKKAVLVITLLVFCFYYYCYFFILLLTNAKICTFLDYGTVLKGL